MKKQNDVPVILIVDDVKKKSDILNKMILDMGYIPKTADSVAQALEYMRENMPQLILLDVSMPDIDGYQMCKALKKNIVTRHIPVLFMWEDKDSDSRKMAFETGADDYISFPCDYSELRIRINTNLRIYGMQQELLENNRRLNKIISEQSVKFEEEQKRLLKAIAKLAESSEYVGMAHHIDNVCANARLLAQALNFTDKYENRISSSYIEAIEIAASVHDIGKITISQDILKKPGKLDERERSLVNTHCVRGEELLKAAYPDVGDNYFMKMAAEVIRSHHENWDGSGYPDALTGEDIPLAARIVRIVDSYDCILGERCYKSAHERLEAKEEMIAQKGVLYDPYLLDVFFKIERQMRRD